MEYYTKAQTVVFYFMKFVFAMMLGGAIFAAVLFSSKSNRSFNSKDVNETLPSEGASAEKEVSPDQLLRLFPTELKPIETFPRMLDLVELKKVTKRLAPVWPDFKIYKVTHAVELWGRGVEFPAENYPSIYEDNRSPYSTKELFQCLLNTEKHEEMSHGEPPLLFRTKWGIGVRNNNPRTISTEGSIKHEDALLSILAESGMSISEPVIVSGRSFSVKDLVLNSMMEFDEEQELEWTLNSLARYLQPGQHAWKGTNGKDVSLDIITNKLLDQSFGSGACYGTHAVYSLAVISRLDETSSFLLPETRRRIDHYFEEVVESLINTQTARGAWPKYWHKSIFLTDYEKKSNMPSFRQEPFQEILSTGHHLDWIAIAPLRFRPPVECITRACLFTLNHIKQVPTPKIAFFYIQFTHAIRGVCFLSGVHPGVLVLTSDHDLRMFNFPRYTVITKAPE